MKKKCGLMLVALLFVNIYSNAQIPVIGTMIAEVIKAIDVKVQKLQNETIWLQQAQSAAENLLSKTKLAEIKDWQQQLSDLYADYFAELRKVKSTVTGMAQVKRIVEMQSKVVLEYGRFAKDGSSKVQYDELLTTSMDILQTLHSVLSSLYSMKDAERIIMITTLKDAMHQCLSQIQSLNKQQMQLAATRVRMQSDIQFVKKLNGIK
jgi:hypothetical protein